MNLITESGAGIPRSKLKPAVTTVPASPRGKKAVSLVAAPLLPATFSVVTRVTPSASTWTR
jgi:hypothetical protein